MSKVSEDEVVAEIDVEIDDKKNLVTSINFLGQVLKLEEIEEKNHNDQQLFKKLLEEMFKQNLENTDNDDFEKIHTCILNTMLRIF